MKKIFISNFILFSLVFFVVCITVFITNSNSSFTTSQTTYTTIQSDYTWPLPNNHTISSYFGYRISPITHLSQSHSGIDIPAPERN